MGDPVRCVYCGEETTLKRGKCPLCKDTYPPEPDTSGDGDGEIDDWGGDEWVFEDA